MVEDDGPDKTEETCAFLLYACQRGDMVSVRKLCARAGADVLPTIADYDLRTPLHIASACGHEGIVRYLLRHGCKRDAVDRFGCVCARARACVCVCVCVLEWWGGTGGFREFGL